MKQTVILTELQAMNDIDILSIVPEDVIADIKKSDPHPFFKAYSIAHEGVSYPKVLGEGYKSISWGRKAIQSIKNAIGSGIKFFKGHNKDNSTDGRRSLGEVVASTEKEIDGKLNTVAIGYFPPETREEVKKYNICSMEAVWNILTDAGKLVGDTIDKLTGIALGSSDNESPAWSGAKQLASVQAFAEPRTEENVSEETKLSFGVVATWVKDHNVFPSQLYTLEDIKKDREFISVVETEKRVAELEAEVNRLKQESQEFQDKLATAEVNHQKDTVSKRLEQMAEDQKWTDKQKAFILNNVDDIEQFDDDGLAKFVERQNKYYQVAAKVHNIEDEVPPDSGDPDVNNPNDFTKAENNELLEADYVG